MPPLVARSPSFGPKWSFDDLEIELLSVPTTSNTHENTDASRAEPYDRLSTLPCPDIGANKLGNSLLEGPNSITQAPLNEMQLSPKLLQTRVRTLSKGDSCQSRPKRTDYVGVDAANKSKLASSLCQLTTVKLSRCC